MCLEACFFIFLTEYMLGCAEMQRSSSQASSGLTPSLSSSRLNSKPTKQEAKDREGGDQAVDMMFDRKRVPLEALVRRSSPIAVAAKEEEPAEPQVGHCYIPCIAECRMHASLYTPLLLCL